jgi:hypothetical protein
VVNVYQDSFWKWSGWYPLSLKVACEEAAESFPTHDRSSPRRYDNHPAETIRFTQFLERDLNMPSSSWRINDTKPPIARANVARDPRRSFPRQKSMFTAPYRSDSGDHNY